LFAQAKGAGGNEKQQELTTEYNTLNLYIHTGSLR